jgi:hypothetical protein
LGAKGALSPRRVQDPKEAKASVLDYKRAAGFIVALVKRMSRIACYTKADTYRIRVDPSLTIGIAGGAHLGAKKILIYDAYVDPHSEMGPRNRGAGRSLRDKHIWVVYTLKMMDQLPVVEPSDIDRPANTMDAKMRKIQQDPP